MKKSKSSKASHCLCEIKNEISKISVSKRTSPQSSFPEKLEKANQLLDGAKLLK